jgi:hypothetical protein
MPEMGYNPPEMSPTCKKISKQKLAGNAAKNDKNL